MRETNALPSVGIENLAARLRGAAHGRDTLDVAQFQFVALDDVARAYGDRWAAEKERVLDVAFSFLQKRVQSSDVLIKGGGGFLLVFGSATDSEAEVFALGFRHALNEFFLGQPNEHSSTRFDVELKSVSVKALADTLADAEPDAVGLRSDARASEQPIKWLFQPVWNVPKEALAAWYIVPYDGRTGTRLPGYQFETGPIRAGRFAEIDKQSLALSEKVVQELCVDGRQALVGVSIHISSLLRLETRRELFAVIDNFDTRFLRYRALKIAGVAPGLPRIYLDEILNSLKTRMGNIVIGAAWDEPDLQGLLRGQPAALGFALSQSVMGSDSSIAAAALIQRIRNAVEITHAAKRPFFIEGQITRDMAAQLASIGVDNISSPLIWPARPAIAGIMKWPADLLAAS